MCPAENERRLAEDFSLIPDPHERLGAIVASCGGRGIAEGERSEGDLVRECVSRVWVKAGVAEGVLVLEWDAESALVRGLAGLVCRIYNGCEPGAAAGHEMGLPRALGLDRSLSPTRLNGLAGVARRIRELAAGLSM